ncbi:hypothetical protein M3Y99_00869400 [Aphelenchoides fujianensis]|nr:hypothetical protein M3Y99_00869400 [Aphelenchoides fujianensis]
MTTSSGLVVCCFFLVFAGVWAGSEWPAVSTAFDLQLLVNEMVVADQERPNFCDIKINYWNRNGKLFEHVEEQLLTRRSFQLLRDYSAKFDEGVINDGAGKRILQEAFLDHVYDSGPFQKLVEKFSAANHPWFAKKSKMEIVGQMRKIWFTDGYRDNLMSTAFKHDVASSITYNCPTGSVGYTKDVSGMLMTASPSFEFAFYTAMALYTTRTTTPSTPLQIRVEGCPLTIQRSIVRTSNGYSAINTIYPVPGDENDAGCVDAYTIRSSTCPPDYQIPAGLDRPTT